MSKYVGKDEVWTVRLEATGELVGEVMASCGTEALAKACSLAGASGYKPQKLTVEVGAVPRTMFRKPAGAA